MHNDYPAKRWEDSEPIDNVFDWSLATSSFIPYQPDRDNYQIAGSGPGWQVRSASINKTRSYDLMDTVFAAANQGADQVACFWSHLPESDFPEQMELIDSLAHRNAAKYPDVKFQYCTAIEAMQLWRGSTDHTPPDITITDEIAGESVYFNITSGENIFQKQPFVAVKNIYEDYTVLECISTGPNQWRTSIPVARNTLAKAAVTVCDTLGNQAMEFITYLPDDAFIDNLDADYTEHLGVWSTSAEYAWGTDSRMMTLSENDSAVASWSYSVPVTTDYNLFIQFPDMDNRAERLTFFILLDQQVVDTIEVDELFPAKKWQYLSTVQAQENSRLAVVMSASAQGQSGKVMVADVLKISALVREKDIRIEEEILDFGAVSVADTAKYFLEISNDGIDELLVTNLRSVNQLVTTDKTFPVRIGPMSSMTIPLSVISFELGTVTDTVEISSDDPTDPLIQLPVSAEMIPYFHTIDNEDVAEYEEFGTWYTSVANIYGPTSRYTWLNANPLASARFYTTLKKSGTYDVQQIVPKTENSTDDALYEIYIAGTLSSSFHIDQNQGSGDWVSIGKVYLPADTEIELWIKDTGNSTTGAVIRTDAVKFQMIEEGTGLPDQLSGQTVHEFRLEQNYPNPFNPVTKILFNLPKDQTVKLDVYNALGQIVDYLIDDNLKAGLHHVDFDATNLPSGVYFYRLQANDWTDVKKMILLK
jgi:hypothetical protein